MTNLDPLILECRILECRKFMDVLFAKTVLKCFEDDMGKAKLKHAGMIAGQGAMLKPS